MTKPEPDSGALHPDNAIIDALGGTYAVASICKIRPPSVAGWRHRGIPAARRQYLEMAYPAAFGLAKAPKAPKLRQRRAPTPASASA
jgi:hypothetical protein